MGKFQNLILISLALLASNVIFAYSPKVDSVLSRTLARDGYASILISMKEGTRDILDNLSQMSFSSRTERSQAVYDALTARAQHSQSEILNFLSLPSTSRAFQFGKVRSLWITNQLGIQVASVKLIERLASIDEISIIQEDEIVQLIEPVESQTADETVHAFNQWGVQMIQAPQAWTLFGGTLGAGITVASIDTGVRPSHEVLRTNYRNDGHGWLDPFDESAIAHDRNGHGSHTVGTIVGLNGFGVAPQANWIACKGLDDSGNGPSTILITCGQFLICPTTPTGDDADCSKTPHVVNNSWGGGGGRVIYDDMIAAWHAAGIIPVFSNGNSGASGCGSAGTPGDRDVIGVGSTTSDDALSNFSSLGPSQFNTMKPEVSAPGSTVMSADHRYDNTYSIKSGTSMAAPHVAGAVALLLSRNPNLTYVQVKDLLQSYADRDLVFRNTSCTFISDNAFPNHHYGHGRINIFRSLQALA